MNNSANLQLLYGRAAVRCVACPAFRDVQGRKDWIAEAEKSGFRMFFGRLMWSIQRHFRAFHPVAIPSVVGQNCYYWSFGECAGVRAGAVLHAESVMAEFGKCMPDNHLLQIFNMLR